MSHTASHCHRAKTNMKNTIIAIATLAVAVLAAIPEDAEAKRGGGGGKRGGIRKFHVPHYNIPSVPIITPRFSGNQKKSGKSDNETNNYAPPYPYQNQKSDQTNAPIQNQSNGRMSLTKKDCLDMQWKLKSEPEHVQFMCSYFGIR